MSGQEYVLERQMEFIGPDGFIVVDGGDTQAIHFGGAAVHIFNMTTQDVTFSIQQSDDGVVWEEVLFSDTLLALQTSKSIVAQGEQAVLFESDRRYIRFSVAETLTEAPGLGIHITQFPPRSAPSEEVY